MSSLLSILIRIVIGLLKAIEMKVIISMSGMSSRFTNAGYTVPKFMIEVDGKKVVVRGVITSEIDDLPVDVDVRVPDAASPGGMSGKGKILLDSPGEFELSVPIGMGKLELQAFQDADSDGPTGNDPFATVWLDIGETDMTDVELVLEEGVSLLLVHLISQSNFGRFWHAL